MSLRRLPVYLGLCLGAVVLAVALFILLFGRAFLNGYGKGKMERAFAAAHPGCVLRIGKLGYAIGANCLAAQSVTLSAAGSTLKVGQILLAGVHWLRLLRGAAVPDALAKASLDAADLDMEFPPSHYGIHCTRLRASVPGSELIAEGAELRPLVGDEEFFATNAYQMTRFHVLVPKCIMSGLAFGELFNGKSYRARSVLFIRPSFDALVNREKPVKPFVKSPLMVHEALAAIRQPLQLDSLSVANGSLTYCERMVARADPGMLTFSAVNLSAEGIANRGEASAAILIRAQSKFMNGGVLKVLMAIPITPAGFSLHYSGSLSAMDLIRLDAFLDFVEHTRITSGSVKEASFEIDVNAGRARGRVRAIYKDLKVAVLDKQTGSARGLGNRIASFFANAFKIHNSNARNPSGSMREGKVSYTRSPQDEFLQFAWFALRSGVLDVINQ